MEGSLGGVEGVLLGVKGHTGWLACDGDQVIGRHGQTRDHRMSVQADTQWHCGEDLPRDPSAQSRGQVAHGVLQKNSPGHTPEHAANSAISLRRAKPSGPAWPNDLWLSGTNRHAPVPVGLYLSRFSESFPLAVAPISRAAALTAEAANGCVTHMSATIGRPGSSVSKSPLAESRWERGGSCCAAAWPRAACG